MRRFFPGATSLFSCSAVRLENNFSALSMFAFQSFSAPATNRSSFAIGILLVVLRDDLGRLGDVLNYGEFANFENLMTGWARFRSGYLSSRGSKIYAGHECPTRAV